MPTVFIQQDFLKRSQSHHPKDIFASSRLKRQLSVSPSRFRFRKYRNVPLGVIHPEQFSAQEARDHAQSVKAKATSGMQFGTYRPGDMEFMEVRGQACSLTNVVPNVVYTQADKPLQPDHLANPFLYVQRLFARGAPDQQYKHPDVFIYFETLRESFRANKNIRKLDYIKVLKAMSKSDRGEFYRRCIEMNEQYFEFFRKFVKGLREKGLFAPSEEVSHRRVKLPKSRIMEMAAKLVITDDKLITLPDFQHLMRLLCYPGPESEVETFFTNVVVGDSPVKILEHRANPTTARDRISLKAFIYNVNRYLKERFKLKGIFSKNAAKQRNVQIKNSVAPFLGNTWCGFKRVLELLKQRGPVDPALDSLIRLKRIYAKHLQTNILKHLLLSVAEIQSTYAHDINRSAVQLESMKEFLDGFLAHLKSEQFTLEEAIDYMVFEQFPQVRAQQLIAFLRKILKYYGHRVTPVKHTRFATVPLQLDAQTTLTRRQVDDFVRMYTEKKKAEWLDFRDLVVQLKEFQASAIEPLKLNHREAWQWNMVAEWLMRKLEQLDRQILDLLQRALEGLALEHKLTYERFLSERVVTWLQGTSQVGHHVPAPRDEIEEAIAGYGVAASQLVQTTSKAAIPIDVRIQSAREVIDSVERHKPKQEKPQTVKIAKNKLKKVDKRPQTVPNVVPVVQPPFEPMFSVFDPYYVPQAPPFIEDDDDLDRKIRNAILLQSRCESTLMDINASQY